MTRVGGWYVQIVYRSAELDGFAGAVADSIIYGRRDLGDQDRAAISWKNLLASVSFLATGAPRWISFRSSCQVFRGCMRDRRRASYDASMSAAATAPGYWRTCKSLGDFPSNPSRPSSTYSSSRRTSIKDGDHRSMAVAETAERTARGRTSRRQRFVVASVGAGLRRFWPARGARPERADVGTRIGDFVSGGFRREGIGHS